MATLVVDPVTRIEGHLRIEAETDANGVVTRAASSGTMMRGIEMILKGRDPRDAWAFTQRICGVCTVVHALTSVRAVESALKWSIPTNARHIRNLLMGTQMVQDQVTHFYQLTSMDWVDITSALSADPVATSNLQKCQSDWAQVSSFAGQPLTNSPEYFALVKSRLASFVSSGQLGLFGNNYWMRPDGTPNPAYKLPAEVNLMLFAHWLEALEWQRKVLRVHAIFGGRNPHPNFVVGGVPCTIAGAPVLNTTTNVKMVAVDTNAMTLVQTCINDMRAFVKKVLRPDVLAVARFYKEWFNIGEGVGNFLSFGDYPSVNDPDPDNPNLFVPRGAIIGRNLNVVYPVDLRNTQEIQEFVSSSWYNYAKGKTAGLHPFEGETEPAYSGPQQAYTNLDTTQPYSWDKTPRWNGKPMEVGPLARVLVMYAKNVQAARAHVNNALSELKLPISAMYSTMGRILAQSIDTEIIADELQNWFQSLKDNVAAGDLATHNPQYFNPANWPTPGSGNVYQGVGYTEAPRGALGHWVSFDKATSIDPATGLEKTLGRIQNYQCVVPTTWNASPRDPSGQESAYEAALKGHKLSVPEQPLELLRTIHSFNPCMACAVHVVDDKGGDALRVQVR